MKNPVTRSTLFLTELILNFFIFIVCAVVCVGLIVKAQGMSRESGELTRAVYLAQTAAEAFRSGGETQTYTDGDLTITAEARNLDGGSRIAEITVFAKDGRAVFTLNATRTEGVKAP